MNKILILGGSIVLLISILITPHQFLKYRTKQSGQLVKVILLKLPNCESGYKNKFLTLKFQDSIYILRTACKYTKELNTGEEIQMLHKTGTNVFLFKEETILSELLASMLIGLLGFVIIIKGLRSNSKQRTT